MKRLFGILLAAGCMFAVSCNKTDDGAPALDITKAGLEFTADGGQGTIEFKGGATPATAVSNQEWLHVGSITATDVSVTADPNMDLLSRSALVTITAGGVKKSTIVSQTGIIFTLGKTAVNFYAMGGDDTTVLFNTRLNSLVPACA
ncbi:MAG: BACON domain-containing protein, partial [Rikenellaceae bacterium]|nr:BACON domain-containing protein [Rikenellaceae bacterium]